jgi:hypothetical protein
MNKEQLEADEDKWREECNKLETVCCDHCSERAYLQACRARQGEIESLKTENKDIKNAVNMSREIISTLKAEILRRDELLNLHGIKLD